MQSIKQHFQKQDLKTEVFIPYDTGTPAEHQRCLDQAVDSFEKGRAVQFRDVITHQEWQYFCDHTTKTGIVAVEMMPRIWSVPTRIRVIEHFSFFHYLDDLVDYSRTAMQFHRQIAPTQTRFFCAVGGGDYDRTNVMQTLYALKFDKESELYHTASKATHSDRDPWQLNPDLADLPAQQLEPYHRWDFMANVRVLANRIQHSDLELVVPNRFPHDPNQITEKDLLSVITGVPAYRMYTASLRSIWQEFGFEYTGTQSQHLVRETVEWLSVYHRLSQSQRQRWQDQQGPVVAHNHRQFLQLPTLMQERYLAGAEKT